jgi:ABC-type thiamine transport system substrate-binding protein
MGKEKARGFLKALAAQQPGLRDGHNITAQLLAAGEFHVVTNTYAHIVARIKGQGGPVQYVFDEPVITYVHPVALAKSAPHPNAGKLLMSFILSADGQRMLRDQGEFPATAKSIRKCSRCERSSSRPAIRAWPKNMDQPVKKCGRSSARANCGVQTVQAVQIVQIDF